MTTPGSGAEIRSLTLMLDGEPLQVERHSPRDLSYVLGTLGSQAIKHSIEIVHTHTTDQNPDAIVSRPSVHAIHLGNTKPIVLSRYGILNHTGIYESIIESNPAYRSYWTAIEAAGFTPHIRRFTPGKCDRYDLMLRNPETDPEPITPLSALPAALGYVEPAANRELRPALAEAYSEGNVERVNILISMLFDEAHASVDRQTESFGPDVRAYAQIGMTLSLATLFLEIQGHDYLSRDDGYIVALRDAAEYAHQMYLDEIADLIGVEIDRVIILSQL